MHDATLARDLATFADLHESSVRTVSTPDMIALCADLATFAQWVRLAERVAAIPAESYVILPSGRFLYAPRQYVTGALAAFDRIAERHA